MKLIYFFYILKKTDYTKLNQYCKYVLKTKNISYLHVILNMLKSFLKYDTAFIDYFYLDFFNKNDKEKSTYASTFFMYKFQKIMNDKALIKFFYDKKLFYKKFPSFVNHEHFLPNINTEETFKSWLNNKKPNYLIAKNSKGQVGAGIEKFTLNYNSSENITIDSKNLNTFLQYIANKNLDLIEVCIEQHTILNKIYAKSLNTLRVITVLDKNKNVNIIGAILRMGADKNIDNFDAGGVSAKVNIKTGIIEGPVIYKTPINPAEYKNHPITDNQIVNIQLPHWNKVHLLVKKAALHIPQVRTVGWDVAITSDGAFLLEGNHNWDKTHWQKCYGLGLKHELLKYLN